MTEQVFDARSPGEMLRTAREKQGLHIAALAAAIKVAPRKLDALEHDRWDELPDAVFVRALAQTVCRTLKIDAAPILQLLPRAGAVLLEQGNGGLNAPFKDRPGRGRDEPALSGLGAVRPMIVAASVLMLAAVAVYFVPDRLWSGKFGSTPAVSSTITPAASQVASAAVPTVPPPLASASEPAAIVEAATPAAPAASIAAAVALPGASGASSVASAAPLDPTLSGPALVKVRARESSWVEVRDASGRALLSRVVVPGELVDLDGRLPIRVTIGNAAVTQLDFRGQPYDLSGVTRDNVARVELK